MYQTPNNGAAASTTSQGDRTASATAIAARHELRTYSHQVARNSVPTRAQNPPPNWAIAADTSTSAAGPTTATASTAAPTRPCGVGSHHSVSEWYTNAASITSNTNSAR